MSRPKTGPWSNPRWFFLPRLTVEITRTETLEEYRARKGSVTVCPPAGCTDPPLRKVQSIPERQRGFKERGRSLGEAAPLWRHRDRGGRKVE
jgi:hypothetical protein